MLIFHSRCTKAVKSLVTLSESTLGLKEWLKALQICVSGSMQHQGGHCTGNLWYSQVHLDQQRHTWQKLWAALALSTALVRHLISTVCCSFLACALNVY